MLRVRLAKSSVCDFRFLNNSIIAMDVEYVELEGGKISSTAQNVDVVIQLC